MASERQPKVPPELHTVADHCVVAIVRSLNRAGACEPLDRCAVLELVARALESRRDASALAAIDTGVSFAAVGRVLGMSRQAARRRFEDTSD